MTYSIDIFHDFEPFIGYREHPEATHFDLLVLKNLDTRDIHSAYALNWENGKRVSWKYKMSGEILKRGEIIENIFPYLQVDGKTGQRTQSLKINYSLQTRIEIIKGTKDSDLLKKLVAKLLSAKSGMNMAFNSTKNAGMLLNTQALVWKKLKEKV